MQSRRRAGVTDVFVPKPDAFASIRIPSAVVTREETLLAFAEGRSANTDQARNRIILKRSVDGGKTWGKAVVLAGAYSMNNPFAVVEHGSRNVLLMYQRCPEGIAERSARLEPSYEGERLVRDNLLTSADGGVTWSEPRDVTRETKRPQKVTTQASGPAIDIQLRHGPHAGQPLIPFNEGPFGLRNVYAVYSDDRGETWRRGEVAPDVLADAPRGGRVITVNEAQLVE